MTIAYSDIGCLPIEVMVLVEDKAFVVINALSEPGLGA
jgi:hypothetical protein